MAWYWQGLIVLAATLPVAAVLMLLSLLVMGWWVLRSERRLRAEIDAADWDRRRAMSHLRDHGWAVTPPDVTITPEELAAIRRGEAVDILVTITAADDAPPETGWTAAGVEREWLR